MLFHNISHFLALLCTCTIEHGSWGGGMDLLAREKRGERQSFRLPWRTVKFVVYGIISRI